MVISQICRLSEEALAGELLEAVFIDQAIKDPSSKEADAESVLRVTHPTVPLAGLVALIAQKLSGERPKGTVVVRGDYGSRRSHALLALYHLASLGSEARHWPDGWNVHERLLSSQDAASLSTLAWLWCSSSSTTQIPYFAGRKHP